MFPFAYEINPAGWSHWAYFGLLIPVLVVRGRMKIRDTQRPLPNRLRHFQVTSFSLVMFAAISLLVARAEWIELFPRSWPPPLGVVAGLVMLVTTVAFMPPLEIVACRCSGFAPAAGSWCELDRALV
jgi:hypothetical protein